MQEAGSTHLVVTYPDELVSEAAAKLLRFDIGRLPVVDRADERKVVGYLGRAGILAARMRRFQDEHVREPGWFKGFSRKAAQFARLRESDAPSHIPSTSAFSANRTFARGCKAPSFSGKLPPIQTFGSLRGNVFTERERITFPSAVLHSRRKAALEPLGSGW